MKDTNISLGKKIPRTLKIPCTYPSKWKQTALPSAASVFKSCRSLPIFPSDSQRPTTFDRNATLFISLVSDSGRESGWNGARLPAWLAGFHFLERFHSRLSVFFPLHLKEEMLGSGSRWRSSSPTHTCATHRLSSHRKPPPSVTRLPPPHRCEPSSTRRVHRLPWRSSVTL